MNMLKGRKTYIVAIAVGVLTTAHRLGYVDDAMFSMILGFLNAGGLATLRAGMVSKP